MDTADGCDHDSLLEAAARLHASPHFPAAVERYSEGLAQSRVAPRIVNKLISHDARWRVVGYLLYLHADTEIYGPCGGATYSRLLDLCTRRREVSPRVVKTVLGLLKLTGFVRTERDGPDRRERLYRPTARMFDFVRQWLSYCLGSLDLLEPEAERSRRLHEEPGFIERFLMSGGRDHLTGTPPADRLPDFTSFFVQREGAFPVIVAVLLAEMRATAMPSRAEIAKRFGLSKTQVTNVLAAGVPSGFFTLDPSGIPAPTPLLRERYGRWVSIELAFYARHMPGRATSS